MPQLTPMTSLLAQRLAQPRFNMMLLGIFATVAMLLAAIGIYGVIAYSVTQRTREIGIRMALGAQRTQMLGMVLRQSLTVVTIGLVIGLLAAFAATRLLASLLYGVGANDILYLRDGRSVAERRGFAGQLHSCAACHGDPHTDDKWKRQHHTSGSRHNMHIESRCRHGRRWVGHGDGKCRSNTPCGRC